MPGPLVIDPDLLDAIQRRYLADESIWALSRETGIGQGPLTRALAERGVPLRNRTAGAAARVSRSAVPVDEAAQRYEAGESEQALAAEYGVGRATLRRRLVDAGVEIRGRSDAMLLRQARATPEQRKQWAAAAHDAVRGTARSDEHGARSAESRATHPERHRKLGEVDLERMLTARGLDLTPQLAVGRYNIDLACRPVAVEVHRGGGHPMSDARLRGRLEHLNDAGWHVIYVWMRSYFRDRGGRTGGRITPGEIHLTDECADKVVAHVHAAQANPASVRQYRVVRSSGEDAP